ncbi:NAD(P)H-hydrate epimerase / ADP-dependent (S)-NAD(P)H-hydrate dehydratase [hydrothermal vent metagenome]|uniref:Nicotinamide nucleotide repair protein n=1 Tax=hydrothermal vent metagenome TaxID=652676 RepID=A0A3B0RRR1_9ZZZZ
MRSAEQSLVGAGVSVDELMLRAGQGAAQYIWRIACGAPCLILCGPGNNGGDGYVIAQWLLDKGVDVTVAVSAEPRTDAAQKAKSLWKGPVVDLHKAEPKDVFVDCLFGTGLSRPVSGSLLEQFKRLSGAARKRIAIDLPSGLNSDTGELLNDLPQYDLTIALGAYKPAHFLRPAKDFSGQVVGVDIGIVAASKLTVLETPEIHPPTPGDYKYTRGLVCVLAGLMPGAARLAAMAAQKSGAGYVKIISAEKLDASSDSIVNQRYSGREELALQLADPRIDIIVTGPGLGRDESSKEILTMALESGKPLILDADALVLLGGETADRLSGHSQDIILTPHEGEFEIISGGQQGDKVTRTKSLAKHTHSTALSKGADTVIASSGGQASISASSSPWLSTAGTGDVLSGVIAARYVVEKNDYLAAKQGQWLHRRAAQLSGPAFSPEMLIDNLPLAVDECLI